MDNLLEIVASYLGTVSFAVLFDAPKKHYHHCGIIGAVGWGIFLTCTYLKQSETVATFAASLVLIYLSREASYRFKAPVTIFLICGIFCLVPGIGIYNFTYSFVINDMTKLVTFGMGVLKIAIAISLGISIGYELPPECFLGYRQQRKSMSVER